jgi:hypothetical protein
MSYTLHVKDRSLRNSSFNASIVNRLPDDGQKLGENLSKWVKYIYKKTILNLWYSEHKINLV